MRIAIGGMNHRKAPAKNSPQQSKAILRAERDPRKWSESGVLEAARSVCLAPARTALYPVLAGRAIEDEDFTRAPDNSKRRPRNKPQVIM